MEETQIINPAAVLCRGLSSAHQPTIVSQIITKTREPIHTTYAHRRTARAHVRTHKTTHTHTQANKYANTHTHMHGLSVYCSHFYGGLIIVLLPFVLRIISLHGMGGFQLSYFLLLAFISNSPFRFLICFFFSLYLLFLRCSFFPFFPSFISTRHKMFGGHAVVMPA